MTVNLNIRKKPNVVEEIITLEELSEHLKLRNLLNSVSNGTEVFSRFDEISVRDLNELFEEEGVSFAISYRTRFNSKYQENILRFTSKTFNGVYRIDNDLIVIKLNNDNIVLRIEKLVD